MQIAISNAFCRCFSGARYNFARASHRPPHFGIFPRWFTLQYYLFLMMHKKHFAKIYSKLYEHILIGHDCSCRAFAKTAHFGVNENLQEKSDAQYDTKYLQNVMSCVDIMYKCIAQTYHKAFLYGGQFYPLST